MAINTKLNAVLNTRHPLLLAPMGLAAGGRLAMAVSDAGGFGMVGASSPFPIDESFMKRELALVEPASVGVGFITWGLANHPKALDFVLSRKPRAVMLSFGDITPYAASIKDSGCLLICQVQSVEAAQQAAEFGADVIVAQGSAAGGHGGPRTTRSLVPVVVDAVAPIPVVAAGGIADGRGVAAALMLGAVGAMGHTLQREPGVPVGRSQEARACGGAGRGHHTLAYSRLDARIGLAVAIHQPRIPESDHRTLA